MVLVSDKSRVCDAQPYSCCQHMITSLDTRREPICKAVSLYCAVELTLLFVQDAPLDYRAFFQYRGREVR